VKFQRVMEPRVEFGQDSRGQIALMTAGADSCRADELNSCDRFSLHL